MHNFFEKDKVNILVTDSGLGGLSVFADLDARIRSAGIFSEVNLSYFNAQPHIKSGYNSMDTPEQKIQVFENALNAMDSYFDPDLLLIACNTLSVLYPETQFSQISDIPVIGVVKAGVDLIAQQISDNPDHKVIIFATKTTVARDVHRQLLVKKGYDRSRFITQACPKLAGAIERGTQSEETRQLVDTYVSQAIQNIERESDPFMISYNCTHYGYIDNLFLQTFEKYGYQPEKSLDPNPYMANFMFEEKYKSRYDQTEVHLKIVSQSELPVDRIESIGHLIRNVSPQSYDALKDHKFTPDLFEWRSIAPLSKN